ncbi:MAG TPA: hypothetical protein VFT43_15525, partial [Candidatus Polarisedimenticolia bacterium]|nr:hypothetical protein [Candidatus Polarisedimenticolia bacterium]
YPALNPRNSARAFSLEIKQATARARAGGGRVVAFGLGNLPEAIAFYSDGLYTLETSSAAEVAAHLSNGPERYAIVDAARLGELPDDLRHRIVEVRSADLNRRRVVLVTAR